MLDRAHVQPEPSVFHNMSATVLEQAAAADNVEDLFHGLEDQGIMMRLDPSVTPTMAKAPTLGRWELEALRTVENVIRAGHVQQSRPGVLRFPRTDVAVPRDATVVHCAADGLRR